MPARTVGSSVGGVLAGDAVVVFASQLTGSENVISSLKMGICVVGATSSCILRMVGRTESKMTCGVVPHTVRDVL